MSLNIATLDASEIVRTGICKAISRDVDIGLYLEAESIAQLSTILNRHQIDLVFCNTLFFNELKDVLATPNRHPKPVLFAIVTCHIDESIVSYFNDVVYLNDSFSRITQKIKQAIDNQSEPPQTKQSVELSDREREVLHLIAKGYAHKEISDELCISIHTVVTHRKNISQKLGIKSTSGLTVYAILNKLIESDEMQDMLQ
jgi:DNA-binding NarL/FixJ family response regulator